MLFDYDDGEFLINTSSNTAMDFDGDMYSRIGDDFAMNLDTGDIHYVSGWDNDDEED